MSLEQIDAIVGPEIGWIRLGILLSEVSHIDVHQCCSGKKVGRLGGNQGNGMIAPFPDKPGCSSTANAIANDYCMHSRLFAQQGQWLKKN